MSQDKFQEISEQNEVAAKKWNSGNEFLPFHPSASHVSPQYRQGWNDCYDCYQSFQHEWDSDGERCLKCGDKDWMASKLCSAVGAKSEESKDAMLHDPIAWRSKIHGMRWLHKQPYELEPGTQFYIRGRIDPVATVRSGASIIWHVPTSEFEHGTFFYPSAAI